MPQSMTAFARAEKTEKDLSVSVEIRSYNSKHLDIMLRMPHGYAPLEERVKRRIAAKIARGRIEIHLQISDTSEAAAAYEIDTVKARAYHRVLTQLKETFELVGEISLDMMVTTAGIIKPSNMQKDPEGNWALMADGLDIALNELVTMRRKEGAFLAKDLRRRLATIEAAIGQIEQTSGNLVAIYRQRLVDRIAVLTNSQVPLDPVRISQEAAILADKSDISEEIVRAGSHIKQFREIMESDAPGGRKLNFLLQEFNREFNTMASKAGNAPISHTIVAVKSELEKIREQVQNVE
ncbi:MAG: YicC family protein [Deltaproteobacteria bacterium]|nr:YicC family protein [Deltaproteobacteria bacterium]